MNKRMLTSRMCSMNAFLSPVNLSLGPGRTLLASVRSSFNDDRQRAKTDSPKKQSKVNRTKHQMEENDKEQEREREKEKEKEKEREKEREREMYTTDQSV